MRSFFHFSPSLLLLFGSSLHYIPLPPVQWFPNIFMPILTLSSAVGHDAMLLVALQCFNGSPQRSLLSHTRLATHSIGLRATEKLKEDNRSNFLNTQT